MRPTPLLLALLVAGAALSAALPAAEAKPYCTFREPDCDGLVCLYGPPERCVLPRPEDIPIPCKDHMCVLP